MRKLTNIVGTVGVGGRSDVTKAGFWITEKLGLALRCGLRQCEELKAVEKWVRLLVWLIQSCTLAVL